MSTLDALKEDELIKILTDPKNAMVKQYVKLMAMDGVQIDLSITKDAARLGPAGAGQRDRGQRPACKLLERIMLDVMSDPPGRTTSQRSLLAERGLRATHLS